ncbi:MAG: hypothetical protein D3924_18275 [Candidatus Electrothrix sp. AR4]|nr:hypothetical protein [Candidatus Electrothrix sp. AR4]
MLSFFKKEFPVTGIIFIYLFVFPTVSAIAHTRCKIDLGFGNWTEGCPHIHNTPEIQSYILEKNINSPLSKIYKKKVMIGVWLFRSSIGYMGSFHFYNNNKAGIGPKKENLRYVVSNNTVKVYGGNFHIEGTIKSNNSIRFSGDVLWKTATKVTNDPTTGINLYEVCKNKGSDEWYCVNKGQGERCDIGISWFDGTSTNYNACRQQCKKMVHYRSNEGFIERCGYPD